MQFAHTVGQLTDKVIELGLLLVDSSLSAERRILVNGLSSDIRDDIVIFLNKLVNLIREIESAKGTFSLDLKPFLATLLVEIVLFIAGENDNIFVRRESDQANDTVGHIRIFLLILAVGHVFEVLHVAVE